MDISSSRNDRMIGFRFQHDDDVSQMEQHCDDHLSSEPLSNVEESKEESPARSFAKSFDLQGKLNAVTHIFFLRVASWTNAGKIQPSARVRNLSCASLNLYCMRE